MSQLPPEMQKQLGSIHIDALVYAEDPSRRFVFINGQVCRVGQRIGETSALLSEITPNGIILDYGGGRASLRMGR